MKANQTSHKDTSGNSVAENVGIENNSNENVVHQKGADNSIGQLKTDTSIPSENNENNNLPSRFPPIQTKSKDVVQLQKDKGTYTINQNKANLRERTPPYKIIHTLNEGDKVTVISSLDEESVFAAGWSTTEHSWVETDQDTCGWIDNSKLTKNENYSKSIKKKYEDATGEEVETEIKSGHVFHVQGHEVKLLGAPSLENPSFDAEITKSSKNEEGEEKQVYKIIAHFDKDEDGNYNFSTDVQGSKWFEKETKSHEFPFMHIPILSPILGIEATIAFHAALEVFGSVGFKGQFTPNMKIGKFELIKGDVNVEGKAGFTLFAGLASHFGVASAKAGLEGKVEGVVEGDVSLSNGTEGLQLNGSIEAGLEGDLNAIAEYHVLGFDKKTAKLLIGTGEMGLFKKEVNADLSNIGKGVRVTLGTVSADKEKIEKEAEKSKLKHLNDDPENQAAINKARQNS